MGKTSLFILTSVAIFGSLFTITTVSNPPTSWALGLVIGVILGIFHELVRENLD